MVSSLIGYSHTLFDVLYSRYMAADDRTVSLKRISVGFNELEDLKSEGNQPCVSTSCMLCTDHSEHRLGSIRGSTSMFMIFGLLPASYAAERQIALRTGLDPSPTYLGMTSHAVTACWIHLSLPASLSARIVVS